MSKLFITQCTYDALSEAFGMSKIVIENNIEYDIGNLNYISPRLGHKNTPEHIEAVRKSHLGKKRSIETRENISSAIKKGYADGRKGMSGTTGMKFSEETRKKMSAAKNGRTRGKYKKRHLPLNT